MGATHCSCTCGGEDVVRSQKATSSLLLRDDDVVAGQEEPVLLEAPWSGCFGNSCVADSEGRLEGTKVLAGGGGRSSSRRRSSGGPQDFQATMGREGVLGCSSIGTVVKTRHRQSLELHALRQISKKWLRGGAWKEEVETLRRLDHPHICKLHDTWEDSMSLYMIMELCKGGNLTDLSENGDRLNESIIALLVEQMVSAVCHLHAQGMAHSDLRPENWLFSEPVSETSSILDMKLKMIDFGLASKHAKKGRRSHSELLASRASVPVPALPASKSRSSGVPRGELPIDSEARSSNGAPLRYLFCQAPEQILGTAVAFPSQSGGEIENEGTATGTNHLNQASQKMDCWALGVLAYFMLSGQSPFPMATIPPDNDLSYQNARFVFMPTAIWRPVSSEAKNFIAMCLQQDPSARPAARQLMTLPWMRLALAAKQEMCPQQHLSVPFDEMASERRSDGSRSSLASAGMRLTLLDPPLPTAPAIRHSFERMKSLQLIERAATIAAAFRIPADGLQLLRKAFETRDTQRAGVLPVQELLHVLALHGVPCDDLAALADGLGPTAHISYGDFADDVRDFQRNTQETAIWEVFSRFEGDGEGRIRKRVLAKALAEEEYQQSLAAKFPMLPLDRVIRELDRDGEAALGFDDFRQVLAEASAVAVDPKPAR